MQGRCLESKRHHVDEGPFVQRQCGWRVEAGRRGRYERVIEPRLTTDGDLNAGYIGGIRHTNPTNENGSDAGRFCRDIA